MLTFFRLCSFVFVVSLLFTSVNVYSQSVEVAEQELDYEIFDIVLREKTLYQSAEFFRTSDGNILAPLQLFEALLEIDLTYDIDTQQFNGNFSDINVTTSLQNLASSISGPTYWSNTELGYYFDLQLLSVLLQSELTVNYNKLSLTIIPNSKDLQLPVEVRLKRESRAVTNLASDIVHYDFLVDDEYRLFTPPKGQVALVVSKNQIETRLNTNLNLYGDVLNHATNLIFNTNTTNSTPTGRLTFKRDQVSPNKKILGVLNNYSFGDVSNTLTRFGIPISGLGMSLSSVDKRYNSYYGKGSIDENVPAGWEVELYKYGYLIAITTATDDGRILFEDLDVNYGTNRFTLKLYGPYGETETRTAEIIVGNQIIKQGNIDFSMNLVDQNKSIFNNNTLYDNSEFIPTLYMQTNIGLGNKTSLGLGYLSQEFSNFSTTENEKTEQINVSLAKSLTNASIDMSATYNDTEEYSYNVTLQGAVRSTDRYRLTAQSDNTDIQTINNLGAYYFTRFNRVSISASTNFQQNESLEQTLDKQSYQLAFSAPIWEANVTNVFKYSDSIIDDDAANLLDTEVWSGLFTISKSITPLITSRFSLDYLLEDINEQEAGMNSARFSMNWRTQATMNGSFDVRASRGGEYEVSNRFAWRTKKVNFTSNITYSSLNDWTIGIGITFNLDYDYYKNEINLQSEYNAQASTLDLFTYEDRNKSGRFDEFDSALSGVTFGPASYWQDLPTNQNGYTYLPNNRINRPFKITYNTRDTKSDLLSPVYDNVYFYTHAGGVTSFDVPFNYTSYLDGLIVNLSDRTVPNSVPLELLTMKNKVLKTFKSDFNSSYALEKVWPGKYKIRIAPGYLEKLGVVSQPAEHLINVKTGTNFVDVPDFELINLEDHIKAKSELAHNEFYTIQFGAYDSREYCALRVNTLKQSGFDNAFYVIEDNECKVFMGEFGSELSAQEFKSTIPDTIIDDGFTVKYREGEDIYSVEVEAYSIQLAAVLKNGKCNTEAFNDIASKLHNVYLLAAGQYCKLYLGDYTSPINARNALNALPDDIKKGAFLVKH